MPFLEKSRGLHPDQSRIHLIHALASDQDSEDATFYVDKEWSGRSSAVRDHLSDNVRVEHVPSISVDRWLRGRHLQSLDLVFKIDVEGFEVKVLAGLKQTIASATRFLGIVEFNSTALKQAGNDPLDVFSFLEAETVQIFSCDRNGSIVPFASNEWKKLAAKQEDIEVDLIVVKLPFGHELFGQISQSVGPEKH